MEVFMKKFLILILFVSGFFEVFTCEKKAPFIIQLLGREAQDLMDVPTIGQTDIFVGMCDEAGAFFDLRDERIYIADWVVPLLKYIPLGALRFVLGHESAHKYYFITRKLSLGRVYEETEADMKALFKLNCYQCLQEYRDSLCLFFNVLLSKKFERSPSSEELSDALEKRCEGGYLGLEELDEVLLEWKKENKLCKYHTGPHSLVSSSSYSFTLRLCDLISLFFTKKKFIKG